MYTCHKCGREIDILPTIAESRYLIRCPSCYEFIHTGFQSKPYVPRVEPGSCEEVAEELIYWRKQAILFRNDEGVTDEELNNAQTGLNKIIEKADELNLQEDELNEAKIRIQDRISSFLASIQLSIALPVFSVATSRFVLTEL